MDFSKLLFRIVKIDTQIITWICQNWYIDFSVLVHGFVRVVTCICQSCYMYFLPFPNKTELKFNTDFEGH